MEKRKRRKGVFVDLRTDFGFKHCLGSESPMRSFLNAILSDDYGKIRSVKFENVEIPPEKKDSRGVTFDLRCQTDDGTEILVEMQNYAQKLFKTRANYYLCRLMDRHIRQGFRWNDGKDIPRMLGIFIMGKPMKGLNKLVTRTAEFDIDSCTEFWDRMRKYYIALNYFGQDGESGLHTMRDIWISIVKNIGIMKEIDPYVLEVADEGLLELIEKARVSALTPEEYARYEAELKIISEEGSAEAYGYDRGFYHHAVKTARTMLAANKFSMEDIILCSGLTEAEIEDLKENKIKDLY